MNIIIPIFLIALSIFGFFGFGIFPYAIDPVYQEIKKLKVERDDFEKIHHNITEIEMARLNLMKQYREIGREDLKRIKSFLPNQINNIKLIVDINTIAERNDIRNIRDIELLKEDEEVDGAEILIIDEKKYNSILLSFSFTTRYENFKNFKRELHKSLRLIDIKSVSITRAKEEQDVLNFNVIIRTY